MLRHRHHRTSVGVRVAPITAALVLMASALGVAPVVAHDDLGDASAPLLSPSVLRAFGDNRTVAFELGDEDEHDETDPARGVALPCETLAVGLPGVDRSRYGMTHIANRCGFVGTDIEFQSRPDATGRIHDYAFLGTMGFGLRIFDITDPFNPKPAGAYATSSWQNDVQIRGNLALLTFDGVAGEPSTTSACMQTHHPEALGQGIDLIRLSFNKTTATFTTSLITCVPNPPGGAHTATIHPSGNFLVISNASSDWAVDVVDLRNAATVGVANGQKLMRYRLIDESKAKTLSNDGQPRCPTTGVAYKCIVVTRGYGAPVSAMPIPAARSLNGLWRPHDVHFSRSGHVMYVAALNSTVIVSIRNLFEPVPLTEKVRTLSVIPNILIPKPPCSPNGSNPLCDPRNTSLSHQVDVSADGKFIVMSDERGGGLTETGCNTEPQSGILGAVHFFAINPISGVPKTANASLYNPVVLGHYFNPNPSLLPEQTGPLGPVLAQFTAAGGRLERGCTAHVFRLGLNGTASPGVIAAGYDGVSRLPVHRVTGGWYGAGTWQWDFSGPTNHNRVFQVGSTMIKEDPRSSWGNTLGWNVQAGAETWSAKEYKGFVYTGDMLRGMDVFRSVAGRDPAVVLTKSGPATATAGSLATYRISYRNLGPAASMSAVASDKLPAGVSFVSASSGGTYSSSDRSVRWKLGTVAVGATGTVSVTVRIHSTLAAGKVLVNRADFTGVATIANPAFFTTTVTR